MLFRLICSLMAIFIVSASGVCAAPAVRVPCSVKHNLDCLKIGGASLASDQRTLLIGSSDGAVSVFDTQKRAGYTITPGQSMPAAAAVVKSGNSIFWLTEDRKAIICYTEPERELSVFRISPYKLPRIQQIAVWNNALALFPDQGMFLLDYTTGDMLPLADLFTSEIASELSQSRLGLFRQGKSAVLVSAINNAASSTVVVRIISGDKMTQLGTVSLDQILFQVVSSEDSCMLITRGTLVKLFLDGNTPVVQQVYTQQPSTRIEPDKISWYKKSVWWNASQGLLTSNFADSVQFAFMPWNEPKLRVRDVACIEGDAWVSTDSDIRRVSLDKKDNVSGYSGFVLVRLGEQYETPADAALEKMAQNIQDWQGTPYLWGGSSRNGTDCSGFVMAMHKSIGVSIPHGSATLATCSIGKSVVDELSYGDVLVMKGHAALYVGNGRTAETLTGKGVGYGGIWGYMPVCVKRFTGNKSAASVKPAADYFAKALGYVKSGKTRELKSLLDSNPGVLAAVDKQGSNLLHWAAQHNQLATAKLLLGFGVKIDARNQNGVTPLQVAASRGSTEVAEYLVRTGASVTVKDNKGRTAMDIAIVHNQLRTVAVLVPAGVKN